MSLFLFLWKRSESQSQILFCKFEHPEISLPLGSGPHLINNFWNFYCFLSLTRLLLFANWTSCLIIKPPSVWDIPSNFVWPLKFYLLSSKKVQWEAFLKLQKFSEPSESLAFETFLFQNAKVIAQLAASTNLHFNPPTLLLFSPEMLCSGAFYHSRCNRKQKLSLRQLKTYFSWKLKSK